MKARLFVLLPLLLLTTACVAGDDSGTDKINGSVTVEAGQPAGNASTINGSIHVEPNAKIQDASTVNGSITLGEHSSANSADTVNGAIALDEGARVAKGIESVNGALRLAPGADVAGRASNVNGHISLDGAHVGGGIETSNGDIDIMGNSRVDGGILVRKPGNDWFHLGTERIPVVTIGPGATVSGTLKFEREVKLYVSDKAHVGQVVGATPIRFTGERPTAG